MTNFDSSMITIHGLRKGRSLTLSSGGHTCLHYMETRYFSGLKLFLSYTIPNHLYT